MLLNGLKSHGFCNSSGAVSFSWDYGNNSSRFSGGKSLIFFLKQAKIDPKKIRRQTINKLIY